MHLLPLIAILAQAAIALPYDGTSPLSRLPVRKPSNDIKPAKLGATLLDPFHNFGVLDPIGYECNLTLAKPRSSSHSDTVSFHPSAAFMKAYSMGGHAIPSHSREARHYTTFVSTCLGQCTYAQYPDRPNLNATKCQAVFVASNAPATYASHVHANSTNLNATTHTVCHFLSAPIKQTDLVRGDGRIFVNALAENVRCPGVNFSSSRGK